MNPFVWLFATILMLALEMLFLCNIRKHEYCHFGIDCILYPAGLANPDPYECTWNTIFTGRSSCTWYRTEVANTYKISDTIPVRYDSGVCIVVFLLSIGSKAKKKYSDPQKLVRRLTPAAASFVF